MLRLGLKSIPIESVARISWEHITLLKGLPIWFNKIYEEEVEKMESQFRKKTTQEIFQECDLLPDLLRFQFSGGAEDFGIMENKKRIFYSE